MQRDSVGFTFTVATVLCVVCSLLVASTAEGLRGKISNNKELDRKKNILIAAGLADKGASPVQVDEIYKDNIDDMWIDLDTGEPITKPEGYDPRKAANNPKTQQPVEGEGLMGIRYREPIAPLYKIKSGGYVLPVYGKGLWGTLWGFLALEQDAKTVKGITFYDHKETPGLGAEVENPEWQAQWPGKEAYAQDGTVQLTVKKGQTPPDSPAADYTIDGLSGATITTKGVDHMIGYWLSDQGFGKYLAKQQTTEAGTPSPEPAHG